MDKLLQNQDLLVTEHRFQPQLHQNPYYQTLPQPSIAYDGDYYSEDSDFSDAVLQYISDILMKEHIEEETFMLQDSLQLQTAEKSFYDVLGEKYPPSPKSHHATTLKTEESRGLRRNREVQEEKEENRINKQAAVYEEPELRSETFDLVLLTSSIGKGIVPFMELRESLKSAVAKNLLHRRRKSRGKKKQRGDEEAELVDVRALLVQCAQAVASNSVRSSNELLAKIRRHSSPFGDGTQRMAHCFANGLEARLAGTGSQIYRGLVNKRRKATDMLKAYHLYLAACPYQRVSNLVSNKTILNVAEDAVRIHVIDFGILYGFQWPTLIQHLADRRCPPRLRITGIDLPQPGFRPADRVEETGRRLANHAESFNVPFEYIAIAKRWESIRIEELGIDEGEIVIVNCMYRFKNLFDETVVEESPRDAVLNLVRRIDPEVFIHGVVNGTHNAPFFVTRFREALFHFSALFDMVDCVLPQENLERMVIEKELFGLEALNSIACEGWERVERPETYKQWRVRNMRAGFEPVPLDPNIVKFTMNMMKSKYHKDFVIDEVSKWLLQGWQGRFLYALSTWKPV